MSAYNWTWTPMSQPELAPAAQPAPARSVNVTDYSDGEKMVVLLLRRGELANDLIDRLRATGAEPSKADWRTMIEHARIARRDGRLQLTPMGLHAAQEIARDLARKLGIHSITHRQGRGNHGPSITCTCGFHTYSSIMNRNGLNRYATEHLQQAATNTLPPAYRLNPRTSPEN